MIITINVFYIIKQNINLTIERILLLSVLSLSLCVFLLPHMHERYLFAADIFSLLYCLLYKRNYLVAILISLISTLSYSVFLFSSSIVPSYLLAFVFFGLIIYLFKDFLNYNNKKHNLNS